MVGKGKLTHYHGVFVGFAVHVRDRAEIEDLFACGSYGKVPHLRVGFGNLTSRCRAIYRAPSRSMAPPPAPPRSGGRRRT